jgi:hypothetical protein
MSRRAVKMAELAGADLSAFERTLVVEARDGTVVTVVRCSSPRRRYRRTHP